MKKIKITDVEIVDGIPTFGGKPIPNLNIDPLHEIFDFEREDLKYIIFKELYKVKPNGQFLDKLIYVNCLSNLLELTIVEDQTIINEIDEAFYGTLTKTLRNVLKFETEKWDPYDMSYDTDKLTKEENGSYSLDGNVCIENNRRTTHFFREFLMLENANGNMLVMNGHPYSKERFKSHQFIERAFKECDIFAPRKLVNYAEDSNSTWIGGYNMLLTELLSGKENVEKVLNVMSTSFHHTAYMNYQDINLEVIEAIAIKKKRPDILFKELMKSENNHDLHRGLSKLGFKYII